MEQTLEQKIAANRQRHAERARLAQEQTQATINAQLQAWYEEDWQAAIEANAFFDSLAGKAN